METNPPVPRAILVTIQLPGVDDVAHAASIEELGRLVKTLGYEGVGRRSQKRDATGGPGVAESRAIHAKSNARERFEDADEEADEEADENEPNASPSAPDPQAPPKPDFVIVDHEISPSQARNLERATGAQVLDRTGVIVEIFHRHAHSREARLQGELG